MCAKALDGPVELWISSNISAGQVDQGEARVYALEDHGAAPNLVS